MNANSARSRLLFAPSALMYLLVCGADPLSPKQSDDPHDYVRVLDGQLSLAGKPFVIRGTNYFGSWRYDHLLQSGGGVEQETVWAFYNQWNEERLVKDLGFIRSQLGATAIRIGTPTQTDFAQLVKFQGYQPWFNPDGTITEHYKDMLIRMADVAYLNGVRIQLCLLWNLAGEISKNQESFRLGGSMDTLYANQVRSIASALRNHPGVLGYSVGNEVLVQWPINGTHKSEYEGVALDFIVRRLHEIRTIAVHQLLTSDEVAQPDAKYWYAPGPEFIQISVPGGAGNRTSLRLSDEVDYLGTHFYPETLESSDLPNGFSTKLEDAKQKLATYFAAAKATGKPTVMNEFGLKVSPETLAPEQYSAIRDRFFQGVLSQGQKLGLQGVLVWGALPEITLVSGKYRILESKVNPFSPIEIDFDESARHHRVLFYKPEWSLFQWTSANELPVATTAAQAVASAWPDVPRLGPGRPN
jgi:hypothetical protein